MPWDGTELWVAQIKRNGTVIGKAKIAGGVDESIFQPEWSPDGMLYFVSDRTGWWNLYRWRENKVEAALSDGQRNSANRNGFSAARLMASHPKANCLQLQQERQ